MSSHRSACGVTGMHLTSILLLSLTSLLSIVLASGVDRSLILNFFAWGIAFTFLVRSLL